MLAQILPGLREIRGPLAAGFLWLLLGWLILHDDVASADGAIKELVDLGEHLTDAALAAIASFAAYLVGSLSEDVFGRALTRVLEQRPRPPSERERRYPRDMSDAVLGAQIVRLENQADRLRAESDLRVAILPPAVALILYVGFTDHWWWLLGLLLAPSLAAQAWVRRRDYVVAAGSLWDLRQRVGIPPATSTEAAARAPSPSDALEHTPADQDTDSKT